MKASIKGIVTAALALVLTLAISVVALPQKTN